MGKDIDLSCVVQREGIQPFQEISNTMVSRETHGVVVVFGFGHDEISDVLFLGLHGLYIEEDMKGWQVVLFLFLLWGGIDTRPTFGARTSLLFPLPLLFLFLRFGDRLNKAKVCVTVDVLMAGGTIQVTALMSFNVLNPDVLLVTGWTATAAKAHGGL